MSSDLRAVRWANHRLVGCRAWPIKPPIAPREILVLHRSLPRHPMPAGLADGMQGGQDLRAPSLTAGTKLLEPQITRLFDNARPVAVPPPSSATRHHDDHGRVDEAMGQIDLDHSMEGRSAVHATDLFDEGRVQRQNDFDVKR